MDEMWKSLFMAFTFIFAMYYSVIAFTHLLSGVLRINLLAVFSEQKDLPMVNIFPSILAIAGWTVFAAEKGLFRI